MSRILRRIPLIICVAAVVLVQRNGHPLLFGLSVLVAFGNLFSAQFSCALDGCRADENSGTPGNPARFARRVYHATSIAGLIILIYALADLYWHTA